MALDIWPWVPISLGLTGFITFVYFLGVEVGRSKR